jgi:hypothetical protein
MNTGAVPELVACFVFNEDPFLCLSLSEGEKKDR